MFSKKPHADVKKSSQKAIDPKRDSPTRLKHLKIFLENVDITEAKLYFETYFSHVYYVFYDIFLNIESSFKQKAQKSLRDELDNILQLFEKILTLLPELIQKKWQCHSIGRVMKKLLHPANSLKLRREGMRLFLIWYQILGDNAPDELHLLFLSLVPDLPVHANTVNPPLTRPHSFMYGSAFMREGVDNLSFSSYSSEASSTSAHATSSHFDVESGGPVSVLDYGCLLPPQPGEKSVEDHTTYYFETLMELMVSQMMKVEWKDKGSYRQQHAFQFLFEKFKKYYLPHIFPHFDLEASIYKPALELPKLRSFDSIYSPELTDGTNMIPGSPHVIHPHHPQYHQHQLILYERLILCQVILIRWVANFTHHVKKIPHDMLVNASTTSVSKPQGDVSSDAGRPSSSISDRAASQEQSRADSVASTGAQGSSVSTLSASSLVEKDSNASMQSNDEHSFTEYMIVRDTLYASRDNVNFVHEVFHQAFLLPFNHGRAMRHVVECYKDWIHMNLPELPAFMLEPLDSKDGSFQAKHPADSSVSDGASDNASQTSGQDVIPKGWRTKNESYHVAVHQDHLNVRAGLQKLLQVFITSAANIFLLEIDEDQPHALLEEQVDMCKRVLNVYRFMVMNVRMEQRTWEQLLMVLLQITLLVLKEVPPVKKESNLGGRLAPALFQTLIVTWIKANLNVAISSALWDKFLLVLSSLTQWEELIREWAKTMETLTRVLARQVYGLDLNDLPLDRLSEQKQKKRRGKMHPGSISEMHSDRGPKTDKNLQSVSESATSGYSTKMPVNPEEPQEHFHSEQIRTPFDGSFSFDRSSLNKSGFVTYTSGLVRSSSDGNLTLKRGRRSSHASTRESSVVSHTDTSQLQGISPALEQEVERIISNAEEYVRENNYSFNKEHPFLVKRKSRSVDSLSNMKGSDTPPASAEFSWGGESPNRSPSPAPSTGVDSNSFKDSPMHLDALASSDNSCSNSDVGVEQCSVIAGGHIRGWLPDVAVVLWRRMLCALGDINRITRPEIHCQVMKYLTDLFETMLKLRNNLGVTSDNQSTPPAPELIPPITLIVPWLFQALNLDQNYQKGKLYAYRLLCTLTVRKHDIPLPRNHVIEFYKFLHHGLVGHNQDVINTIVKYCGPSFFYSNLPGSTLLILDFIFAANTVASSPELKDFPRTEALSILGALLCFPKHFAEIPVFQPNMNEPKIMTCNDAKEHLITILLKSGKREPAGLARCIAISSLGIYIYEELAHRTFHSRIREALSVLLTGLRFNNRAVAQVASDMLLLLKDHATVLLEKYPDIPIKIIEELSSTLLLLLPSSDTLPCNSDRKLLVSLMFCVGEWCMAVPLSVLVQSKQQQTLQKVFKVLNTAAVGNNSSSSKKSEYTSSLDEMNDAQDFDPNIQIDNLRESGASSGSMGSSDTMKREPTMSFNPSTLSFETKSESKLIRLAACTVIYHLINHLNHFPIGIGASRLNSMVNENDDLISSNVTHDELSVDIFQSSNVQLFILNNDMLVSFIEIPALEVPGGGITVGLNTAKSQVRLIIRTLSGKFSWDSTLLYSLSGTTYSSSSLSHQSSASSDSTMNATNSTPSPSNRRHLSAYAPGSASPASSNLSINSSSPSYITRQRSLGTIPIAEDSTDDVDNLDDLLQYIGHTSPDCLLNPGCDLNIPSNPPCDLSSEIEQDTITMVLNQSNFEMDHIKRHDSDNSVTCKPVLPVDSSLTSLTPFQHCRLLLMELGLISWEKRPQFDLLKKNEKLLRELKNLDNQNCRETHKIAVIYVAEGQEDKNSVLRNCGGSQAYEEFVAGLAWEVELETHAGFMGGLQRNRSTGDTAPYYATSFMEVVFHVATRMPSNNEDSFTKKLRHLGNDEIHIVWSEHSRDYRRGIIATEFCDVLIVIYPLPNNLFRIQISRKPEVPYFGPLFNGAIIDQKILPGLVRATAINASRAKRSLLPLFQNFYEERARSLETIRKNHKDPKTFEEFSSCLYDPGFSKFNGRSFTVEHGSKNINASPSNLTSALIDSGPRTPPTIPLRQRPMSLSSATEKITYRTDGSPVTPRSASYNMPSM